MAAGGEFGVGDLRIGPCTDHSPHTSGIKVSLTSTALHSPQPRDRSRGPAPSPLSLEVSSDSVELFSVHLKKVFPHATDEEREIIDKAILEYVTSLNTEPTVFSRGDTFEKEILPYTFILLEDPIEGGTMLIVPEAQELSPSRDEGAAVTASEKRCFSAQMINISGSEEEIPMETVVLVADSKVASIKHELSALIDTSKGGISGHLLPVKYCFAHKSLSIGIQQKHTIMSEAMLSSLTSAERIKAAIDLSQAIANLFRNGSFHGDLRLENCAMYTNRHGTHSFGLFDFGELRRLERPQGRKIGHLAEISPEMMLAKMMIKLKRPDLFFFNPRMANRVRRMRNNKYLSLVRKFGQEKATEMIAKIKHFVDEYDFSPIEKIVETEGPMSDEAEQKIRFNYGKEQEIFAFQSILFPILEPILEEDRALAQLLHDMRHEDPAARPTIQIILRELNKRADMKTRLGCAVESIEGSLESIYSRLAFQSERLRQFHGSVKVLKG